MDVRSQEAVVNLAREHGKEGVIVLLGSPDPESAEIAAETVVIGDPSWAGPLAGAQLGLVVHHILDPVIQAEIPEAVWNEQIGVMADVLDAAGVTKAVEAMRKKGP
jgi:betaine reductase